MAFIVVCPLSCLEATAAESRAQDVVSLMVPGTAAAPNIVARRRLWLELSDIVAPVGGLVMPAEEHVRTLLQFAESWDRQEPLLIHCYAGVSRSTAAAFVTACALQPGAVEIDIAAVLRAASPTATPNPKIVALGDAVLGRGGRMIEAVASIGRGADCYEGAPFRLEIET